MRNLKTNILNFLPNPCTCKADNFVLKIEESRRMLERRNDPSYEELFVNLILANSTVGKESWGKREYAIFFQSILRIDDKQLAVSKEAILNCLCASKIEIMANLRKLADRVEFYPEVERTYIKETKTFQIKEKVMDPMDCFAVIQLLFSRMRSYTAISAKKIVEETEDMEEALRTIKEIKTSREKHQNILLDGFNEEFAYIKELPLFTSLFYTYRENYFEFLLKSMYEMHGNICQKKVNGREAEIKDQQIKSMKAIKKKKHLK